MYVYGDEAPTDAVVDECVPHPLCRLTPPHVMVFGPDFAPYEAALAHVLSLLPDPTTFKMAASPWEEDPSTPLSLDTALERAVAAKQRGNELADLQGSAALDAPTRPRPGGFCARPVVLRAPRRSSTRGHSTRS
ncbi:hypothetical protein FA95DRAFT_348989 [Auriscalpium vulgare]|uniref:Uncharacterized protein n=1 Tax=Auriscalpium vulgare TaxID=40419 RepID=A0ACB8RJG5_9AGAM|nr:hypothetical protein FA95DRAFT_348989 [Auriscalpium vulgare]